MSSDRDNRPDPTTTIRDHLANERTLLSWVRLSIAITALGFVVARFGLFLTELSAAQGIHLTRTGLSAPIGVVLVLAGPVFAVLAFLRYLVVEREIDEGNIHHHHVLLYVLVGMTALGSLGLAAYLIAVAIAVGQPLGGF